MSPLSSPSAGHHLFAIFISLILLHFPGSIGLSQAPQLPPLCSPDCVGDTWGPSTYACFTGVCANVPPDSCKVCVWYSTRWACDSSYYDIQIRYIRGPFGTGTGGAGCLGGCALSGAWEAAIYGVITTEAIGIQDMYDGSCAEYWRIMIAGCWKPDTADAHLPGSKWISCGSGPCCLHPYELCYHYDSTLGRLVPYIAPTDDPYTYETDTCVDNSCTVFCNYVYHPVIHPPSPKTRIGTQSPYPRTQPRITLNDDNAIVEGRLPISDVSAELIVSDISGRQVYRQVSEAKNAIVRYSVNRRELPSGAYVFAIVVNNRVIARSTISIAE